MTPQITQQLIYGFITLLFTLSATVAQASFEGKHVNVRWEIWNKVNPGHGGAVLAVTDEQDVVAGATNPDIKDFHNSRGTFERWDIDFTNQGIDLTYTSIIKRDFDHQYMYLSAMGFHFEDTENNLPDIIDVKVESGFTPFGFNPNLLTFDANNIYLDLKGSMCHTDGMASMPTCTNVNSPTGYDNQIKLRVTFSEGSAKSAPDLLTTRTDALYDWAENEYPQYFPQHKNSIETEGYYARYYPSTQVYLGTKDGRFYVYGNPFNGLSDLGTIQEWLDKLSL